MSSLEVIEADMKHHDWRITKMESAITNLADTVNKFIGSQNVINNETKIKIALAAGITSTVVSAAIGIGIKVWIK